jgi:transcription initiation factor TFIID subunit 10
MIIHHNRSTRMANAESPDPSADLVPVANKDEEVDPVAPAPEPKLPTRKDASLKEFMSKMDDYAPIVSSSTNSTMILTFPRFQTP